LVFLADGVPKLDILNFQLHGTNENVADTISAENAFESTLLLQNLNLDKKLMKDFSNIVRVLQESNCDFKLGSVRLEQMSDAF
jgi:hypothetical protein